MSYSAFSLLSPLAEDLILVSDGSAIDVLTVRGFAVQNIFIFEEVHEVPLIWCIQGNEFQVIEVK